MDFKPIGCILAAAGALFLASTAPAAAYLDPGTGNMMLQSLIGALVGGMVAIRIFWQKIRLFLRLKVRGGGGELDPAEKRERTPHSS